MTPQLTQFFSAQTLSAGDQDTDRKGDQYRDGDRNASSAADVVVLHSLVRGFKAGSERLRQVTTVAGATSITVHCQFTNAGGQPLLAQDVNGKVRFFGGNLRATYDFAKKAARVAEKNFSAANAK